MGVYLKAYVVGPTYDPDAQAVIAAIESTGVTLTTTEKDACNQLIVDLKGYGIWTKMKAVYGFLGGTAGAHKWNWKDPRDLDAAYRLVFNGGWTHSAQGVQPNGTNGYANTFYNLSANSTITNVSAGAYNRTNILNTVGSTFGVDSGASNFAGTALILKSTDGNTYWAVNDNLGNGAFATITDVRGFFIQTIQSTDNAAKQLYRNGSLIRSWLRAQSAAPNLEIAFAALNRAGTIQNYDARQSAFLFFGDTLTSTEAANFYTAVQAYQTTLSRQV